ncbi:amidohydrolase [Streptomyces sp. TRM70308]|uniref:amidohydrolase n=1 Tax=Streptomyces sp. TRM70308 TaxID=3131932 RepID=UPI003D0553B8
MPHRIPDGWTAALLPGITALYKDLHSHPELSGQEVRTAGVLAGALATLDYETHTGVGGTGVVAVLRNGPGPTVMLRADIDALPVKENTGLPYASTRTAAGPDGAPVPVMHACGHDMHAACLVGAAHLLHGCRDTWSGTLLLVFQPAEELLTGARDMIADGFLDRFPVPDIVLAQHVAPLPAGVVGHREGEVMAGVDEAAVTLYGRGGHGARPETTVDPVLLAASVVVRLQSIVSRETPPQEAAVLTVGRLQAGTTGNTVPDTAELSLTIRTYTERTRDAMRAAVERIVRAEAAAGACPAPPRIAWTTSAPVLVSDPEATRTTVTALARQLGPDRLVPMPPVMASEDVGAFGRAAGVPTVFWFWGGLAPEAVHAAADSPSELPGNHAPAFAPVLRPTLETGVQNLTTAALAWLGQA